MLMKIIGSILAASLLILFLGPVVIKLKSFGLTVVILIGVAMMLIDSWQAFKESEE